MKPYMSVLETYYADTEIKWRPPTKEEEAALRAAARDPDNKIKMTRFSQPPTVAEVVAVLKNLPQDAKVLVSSDYEGNYFSALLDISAAHPVSKLRCRDIKQIAPDAIVVTLYPR